MYAYTLYVNMWNCCLSYYTILINYLVLPNTYAHAYVLNYVCESSSYIYPVKIIDFTIS